MPETESPATLYVVPTPLGHLSDVTLRALEVLREVEVIASEDTRRTRKLLAHHRIGTRPVSLHRFNEEKASGWIVEQLEAGRNVAYVTDAGTPAVSDPGARLVSHVRAAGHPVLPLPGPCAAVTALSASGWEGPFVFEGYPSRKGRQRTSQLARLARESRAVILYEAPTRIRRTLEDLARVVPAHRILLAREMTKIHEQYLQNTASRLLEDLPEPVKGEITLVIMPPDLPGKEPSDEGLERAARAALDLVLDGTGLKSATRALGLATGLSARRIYETATRIRRQDDGDGEKRRRR